MYNNFRLISNNFMHKTNIYIYMVFLNILTMKNKKDFAKFIFLYLFITKQNICIFKFQTSSNFLNLFTVLSRILYIPYARCEIIRFSKKI